MKYCSIHKLGDVFLALKPWVCRTLATDMVQKLFCTVAREKLMDPDSTCLNLVRSLSTSSCSLTDCGSSRGHIWIKSRTASSTFTRFLTIKTCTETKSDTNSKHTFLWLVVPQTQISVSFVMLMLWSKHLYTVHKGRINCLQYPASLHKLVMNCNTMILKMTDINNH